MHGRGMVHAGAGMVLQGGYGVNMGFMKARQGEAARTDGKGAKGRIALKPPFYWPLFAFVGV